MSGLDGDAELHVQVQHRLIDELTASESRYRDLVHGLPHILFVIDGDGHIE